MRKFLILFSILLSNITFAYSDPCKIVEEKLDKAKSSHEKNIPLNEALREAGNHRELVKQSWKWLEKGDIKYNVWRIGHKAGCESLNQGVFYYNK